MCDVLILNVETADSRETLKRILSVIPEHTPIIIMTSMAADEIGLVENVLERDEISQRAATLRQNLVKLAAKI